MITGGNSGAGAVDAKLFSAEGATMIITARREAALMQTVIVKFGKIDILVNNAGILEKGLKPIDCFTDKDMDCIVETNQKGTIRCMCAASKRMNAGASIVNVASVAGYVGCGGADAYVSSKTAIIGMTKHTAQQRFADQLSMDFSTAYYHYISIEAVHNKSDHHGQTWDVPLSHIPRHDLPNQTIKHYNFRWENVQ